MQTVNPELRDIQQEIDELKGRMNRIEEALRQIRQTRAKNFKLLFWQFVIFSLVMFAIIWFSSLR